MKSFLIYLFISFIGLLNETVEGYEIECGNVDEEIRKDCGYSGISQSQCKAFGCCFVRSQRPGVPWCFHLNDTHFRTTTQSYDVTTASSTQSSQSKIPDWLKELLRQSKSKKTDSKYKERAENSYKLNPLASEIRDELDCHKTYQLYKKINGESSCQVNVSQRETCVEKDLPKKRGESECTACLKLECCYDPIKRMTGDRTVAPHCFKPKHLLVLTYSEATTLQSTTSSLTQPSPTTSSRFQYLLNMFDLERKQNPGLNSNLSPSISPTPDSDSYKKTDSTSKTESVVSATQKSQRKKNKLLMTYQPTAMPNLFPSPNFPSDPKRNPLFNQNKKSVANISPTPVVNRKNKGVSPLIRYILMKKAGMKPSLQDVFLNRPSGDSTLGNLRKSVNPLASLYRPQNNKPAQSGLNYVELLKYFLNSKKSGSKKKNTQQKKKQPTETAPTAFVNLLHNKVRESPIKILDFKENMMAESKWAHQHVAPVPIEPNYETEKKFEPLEVCFPKNCGHRTTDNQITQRIVGGQWAGGIEYWPWAASLRRTFTDDNRFTHICGAAVISKRWMLTAAHCFTAYEKRGKKILGEREKYIVVYTVYVGQYYRNTLSPTLQVHSLESFIPHPKFDFEGLNYDIAVAKFSEPVIFNSYVQPVCLPGKFDRLFAGERSWVVGWGDTKNNAGLKSRLKLKELPLPLISSNQCKNNWPQHFHKAWICTEASYMEDACAGDSGGPLVKRGAGSRWEAIGVAIAGTRQCSTNLNDVKPGIYTKVAYYRDFIDSATSGGCEEAEQKSE